MKLILIGCLRRHGGTLLARLFDGHPDCYALPVGHRFSRRIKKRFSTYKSIKDDWPDFDNVIASRDAEKLIQILDIVPFSKLANQIKRLKHDAIDLRLNEADMLQHFRAKLDETRQWTRQSIWDTQIEVFYQSLCGGVHWKGPRSHVVNHCATSIFLPLEPFFTEFPESRFIYPFRSPQAYYASIKGRAIKRKAMNKKQHWMVRGDDDFDVLDLWMKRWAAGVSLALLARLKFGERMVLLRYEDLLLFPQPIMRAVAKEVGLKFDTILARPTVLGQKWSGNSAFGSLDGLSTAPLDRWRSKLTGAEQERIAEQTQDLLDTLGYSEKDAMADFNDPGNIDWSGIAGRFEATTKRDVVNAADQYRMAKLSVANRVLGAFRPRTSVFSHAKRFVK